MTLEELKNSPILTEIIKLSELFERVRYPFAQEKGWMTPKRTLPVKEPWLGKNFKHFAKLYRFFKEVPEIIPEKYFYAQFIKIKGREVYVTDLVSEYAVNRYKTYIKNEDKYGMNRAKKTDIFKIKEKDRGTLDMLQLTCGNDMWNDTREYRGLFFPAPIVLWLNRKITHYYLIENYPEETIKWSKVLLEKKIIDKNVFRNILLRKDIEDYEGPDGM